MYHYVYKTTIISTGEYYIGKHSTAKLNDKYIGSGVSLLEKVTEDTPIHFEILQYTDTEDAAYDVEQLLISDLWKADPLCLNRVPGGKRGYIRNQLGVPKSEEWKRKISEANRKPKTGKALEACIANSKLGAAARNGQRDSEEVRLKRAQSLSKTLSGVLRPDLRKTIIIEGTKYVGLAEVSSKFGVTRQTVYNRIKSPDWDWHYDDSK